MKRKPKVCDVCPSRFLCEGEFNVVRPGFQDFSVDSSTGYRVNSRGEPTCVHPEKSRLPLQHLVRQQVEIDYESIPSDPDELGPWMAANVDPDQPDLQERLDTMIDKIGARFSPETVIAATRAAIQLHEAS